MANAERFFVYIVARETLMFCFRVTIKAERRRRNLYGNFSIYPSFSKALF